VLKRYDTGEEIKLSDFKGKTVLLNFFATWCGPCRAETPGFVKVYEEYKGKDVVFLSVNTGERGGDPHALVKAFVERYGVQWPVVMDEPTAGVANQYGVSGIPTNIVIDKDGIVKFYKVGGIHERELTRQLDRVLGLGAAPADQYPNDPE